MPQLLKVCPRGAWLSEDHAVKALNLSSKSALKDAFREGSLPHVYVEHGKRFSDASSPFNKKRFFYIHEDGKAVSSPEINFLSWVNICKSLEEGNVESLSQAERDRIKDYTGYTDAEDSYADLKAVHAIVTSSELSGEDGDDGYRYGSNGSRQRSSSKGPANAEGEIYTRADGKKVRRVRRTASGKDGGLVRTDSAKGDNSQRVRRLVRSSSAQGSSSNLAGNQKVVRRVVRRSNSSHAGSQHRRSLDGLVGKDEPQMRKVKRSSSSHSGMVEKGQSSLGGFLAQGEKSAPKSKLSGSRSLAAGEGETYTRADGKKGEYQNFRLGRDVVSTNQPNATFKCFYILIELVLIAGNT